MEEYLNPVKEDSQKSEGFQPTSHILNNQCPICLCNMEPATTAQMLSCPHVFCVDCLVQWLEHSRSCPMCRTPVPDIDQSHDPSSQDKTLRIVTHMTDRQLEYAISAASSYLKSFVSFTRWMAWVKIKCHMAIHAGFRSRVQFMVKLNNDQLKKLWNVYYGDRNCFDIERLVLTDFDMCTREWIETEESDPHSAIGLANFARHYMLSYLYSY